MARRDTIGRLPCVVFGVCKQYGLCSWGETTANITFVVCDIVGACLAGDFLLLIKRVGGLEALEAMGPPTTQLCAMAYSEVVRVEIWSSQHFL